jgi:hypothetical protein
MLEFIVIQVLPAVNTSENYELAKLYQDHREQKILGPLLCCQALLISCLQGE